MQHLGLISHFIDGRRVGGEDGRLIATINPATGNEIGHFFAATASEINRAIAATDQGFARWRCFSAVQRARVLRRAADLLRQHNERLAHLEVLDTGKPISEALVADILSGADCFEYFAALAAGDVGQHITLPGALAYTRREPLGVVAAIGAWNYPIQIACWKAAPALACGNAVIFKPSELTPVTAVELAELLCEAGLPAGVFNVLQGTGEVGAAIAQHPGIAKVSLTGSVPTGQKVAAAAGAQLKRYTLELGGKSPLIVCPDANLAQAVHGAIMANFYTQGEICSNGTRVFVHRSIHDAFLAQLLPAVAALKIGDPLDPTTTVGALISAEHHRRVCKHISNGLAEGASLIAGGESPHWSKAQQHLSGGYFLQPTVFSHCHDDMSIVREEIFGPVMSILTYDDEKEVTSRANNTPFGLAAGIYTRDIGRAHRMAAELAAGIVWINNYNVTPVEIPFGGVKHSGVGRENGWAALSDYSQLKTVYVEVEPQ